MIILVGASASGKTEVAKRLFTRYGLKKVITHTTRIIRPSETRGVDYHFVSREEFFNLKEKGIFVETALYNGNYYGTSFAEVGDDKVLIVEPHGLAAFKNLKDPRIVAFFLETSATIRRQRMHLRGDEEDIIKSRLADDEQAFSQEFIAIADYALCTDDLTIDQVARYIYETYQKHLRKFQ
ncbi:MAG: guanylate kinase [Bacilli bacterium]|jgi:guanylate kinase